MLNTALNMERCHTVKLKNNLNKDNNEKVLKC